MQKTDVAFYFKQRDGSNKKKTGSTLKGKLYKEVPQVELAF